MLEFDSDVTLPLDNSINLYFGKIICHRRSAREDITGSNSSTMYRKLHRAQNAHRLAADASQAFRVVVTDTTLLSKTMNY